MYLITIGPNSNIGLATMHNGERLALSTVRSIEINDKECESIKFIRSTMCDDIEYVTIFVITPWSCTQMNGTFTEDDETISGIKSGKAIEEGDKLRIIHGPRSATLFGIKEPYAISYIIGRCDTARVEQWLTSNRPIEEQWMNGQWQWDYDEIMTEFCEGLGIIAGNGGRSGKMMCQCCSNNKPDDAFFKLGRIGETSARGFAYSYICDMCYSLWLLGCVETTYIGGVYSYRSTECDKKDVAKRMKQYKTWFRNNERHSQIRRKEIAAAIAVVTKGGGS